MRIVGRVLEGRVDRTGRSCSGQVTIEVRHRDGSRAGDRQRVVLSRERVRIDREGRDDRRGDGSVAIAGVDGGDAGRVRVGAEDHRAGAREGQRLEARHAAEVGVRASDACLRDGDRVRAVATRECGGRGGIAFEQRRRELDDVVAVARRDHVVARGSDDNVVSTTRGDDISTRATRDIVSARAGRDVHAQAADREGDGTRGRAARDRRDAVFEGDDDVKALAARDVDCRDAGAGDRKSGQSVRQGVANEADGAQRVGRAGRTAHRDRATGGRAQRNRHVVARGRESGI